MGITAGAGRAAAGDGTRPRAPRTLLVGGTGFIGRHVRAALSAAGHDVLVVARDPARSRGGDRFVSLDLALPEAAGALARLLDAERPDIVVNAAGAVWAPTDQQLSQSNLDLVQHLLDALATLPRPPRLVHLGSVNEYAPTPAGAAVDESAPIGPLTSYGKSKACSSAAVLRAMRRGPVRGVVLRLANVAGPGMPPVSLLGSVAGQLSAAAGAGERATVRLHTMRARRDFLDYQDAARAIVTAATATVSGRAVNIGRGEAVSVRSLVGLLVEASGVPADIEVAQGVPAGAGRPAEAEWLRVDPRSAAALLHWTPRRELRDTVRDLWEQASSGP